MHKLYPISIAKDLEDTKVLLVGICIEKGENFKIDDGTDVIEGFPVKGNFDVGDYVLVSGKIKGNRVYVEGAGKIDKELYDFLKSLLRAKEEEVSLEDLKREVLMYLDEKGEVTLEELIDTFGPNVKKVIEELLYSGEIFEPSPGKYRKI